MNPKGNKTLIITIDGPAGAGKSTVSRALARRLSYTYLDTGAIYRALAYHADLQGIHPDDEAALASLCNRSEIALKSVNDQQRVLVDQHDVTDFIRTEKISLLASKVSALPAVRTALLSLQREVAVGSNVVAEGRDMGTVVFPDADYKFYLDAKSGERAKRRHRELAHRGGEINLEDVRKDMKVRDGQDQGRKTAPLRASDDAIIIDSTDMTVSDVINKILELIGHRAGVL